VFAAHDAPLPLEVPLPARTHLIVAGLVSLSALTHATVTDAQDRRVDPSVMRAMATGIVGPRSLQMGPLQSGKAPVILELTAPASTASLGDLVARGARLRTAQGEPLWHDRFVPAMLDPTALQAVLASPHVRRVRSSPASTGLLPLDHSAALMGLAGARGSRPALDLLTGEGIVVADLDSNADVFHPQFFRADAGWHDWIDVNGDGVFEPGVDAIDLDRDGSAGPTETAAWLKARTLLLHYGDEVPARGDAFDPSIDWVYLDENDNGQRDYGAASGFTDGVPAFGEPLFVPDDVNRNGRIDVGERVARLGTSKFKKVYVHIEYYAEVDRVFVRGVDMSSHKQDFTGGAYGYSDALHGTGVLSIVAGDVPLVGRRWVGIAPDADLLLGFEVAQEGAKALTWALGQKPDVMLHEIATWTGEPMDGSDAYSSMVDTSVQVDEMTHTCPTGNLGGSRKHAFLQVGPGATVTADLDVPAIGATYVQAALNVRGGSSVSIVLHEPSGTTHDITDGPAYGNLSTGALYYVGNKTSDRGTSYWDTLLYEHEAGKPVPTGGWQVQVTNEGTAPVTVDAYAFDEVSGWGVGAAWDASIATDASTAGIPSVSDHCIAVGAHTGHAMSGTTPWFNQPGAVGEVRDYSGRGPRIDGVQKPDVVAPDNPWSAAPNDRDYDGDIIPHGAVWPFGGTSGATPHVTGVAALMAQAGLRGLEAREALRSSAARDGTTGAVPNMEYGWGRIDAAAALGAFAAGYPPEVQLTASATLVTTGEPVTLTVTATDSDGSASDLEAKWDDGYDGTWDVAYGPLAPRTVSYDAPGHYPTKVRARDGQGRIDEAVVWVEVTDGPVVTPDAGVDAGAGGSAGGGGSDAGTAPPDSKPSSSSDDGCGCRTPGRRSTGTAMALVIAAAALVLSRRRR
jgi:hypothetical protein